MKLSYNCMPNISILMSRGNSKNLKRNKNNESPNCNCTKKENCPLKGRLVGCLGFMVYQPL